jgi:diguanylate cyclase (GGDEF)-like protein/PAS domain S-box-containing protein
MIRSSLLIPIKSSQSKGLIGCFSLEAAAFKPEDKRWLEVVVDIAANSIFSLKEFVEAEKEKMQSLVESMADGILMADANGEIIMINASAKRMLRIARREDLITKKYLEETLGFYPFRLTTGLVHKEGSPLTIQEEVKVFEKTLHSILSPVYSSTGDRTGTLVVLRDISDQKSLEERKSEFLSVISHELRTPLASIGGSVDLVLKNVLGQITEKQRRYLELAKDSCQKLNLVIDDLLDLSKFERGKMEIIMEPITVMKLVEEVALKFQPFAMEKEIIMRIKRTDQDTAIYGDFNRLVQVMNNLLSNAIKFTPAGGEIQISVFVPNVNPSHVGVSVKDTGPGILAEDLERVFDKFEQVQRSNTRKIGGTGLGLAISRSIIEAHKGKIWVESRTGQGAKFIFLLPVEKRTAYAPEIYAELTPQSLQEEISAVIIAEDPDTAYLLKGLMLERGFKAFLPETIQEGLLLIRNQQPKLVLLDLESENASKDLVHILSHDPETSNITLIGFFRSPQEDSESWAQNVMLARKPLDMIQFLQLLSQALTRIRGGDLRKKILIVDDDVALRMIFREALEYQKYDVIEARDGARALEQLKNHKPDLILLDIMLPGIDGMKIAQIIKSNMATSHIPIIFLTAKDQTEDKVKALKAGGNDYLVKPIDATELGARIEGILRRTEEELYSSPTTKLPGSVTIEREINRMLTLKQKFALCYLDLDNLKAYNDVYGYAKADGVVRQTGDIIRETVLKLGTSSDFVGHVAGDDFVFITRPELADRICLSIIQRFDQIIPFFYNEEDRERGYIEAEDRYGVWRKFPIMSISVASLTNEENKLTDHVQIATLAAEFKRMAKAIAGSVYIRNGKKIPGRRESRPKEQQSS